MIITEHKLHVAFFLFVPRLNNLAKNKCELISDSEMCMCLDKTYITGKKIFASKNDDNYSSITLNYILLKQWTESFYLSSPSTALLLAISMT